MRVINLLILCFIYSQFFGNVEASLKFELNGDRPRCFVEELYKSSVMMVKWKISGMNEPEEQKAKAFLNQIQLAIIEEKTGGIVKRDMLGNIKGKVSYHAVDEGLYKICITYHGGWTVPYHVLIGVKINSDNMDEPDIKQGLKLHDTDPVHKKINDILSSGRKIVEKQKAETEEEDHTAVDHIHYTKYYFNLAVLQVLVVLVLGVYQVFRFRKFLSSNDFI